jgi:dTDP-4-dehydrorhamnose reductase
MRVLVVGSAGHLGSAVAAHVRGFATVLATTRESLDVRDHRAVRSAVDGLRPDVVINGSAYTDVDRAEDEPVAAMEVNAFAVRVLAAAAASVGAAFVHYSTDFVFDGTASSPYVEEDQPNPRSTYACSKLVGEWFAREAPQHYVLRVESVFGVPSPGSDGRRTSLDRIVDGLIEGRDVPVFVDRTVSPSHRDDVARATWALVERGAPPGLYHCVNTGRGTWEDVARDAARQLGIEPRLVPLRMADTTLRAQRPVYCAMSNAKLARAGVSMPTWQDALGRYLAARRAPRRS